MSLWKIAWRSLQQRALASWLTGVSMALGIALVAIVLTLYGVMSRSFSEAAGGYNLLVGKKGGSLQLVFNTVFHIGKPIENIPYNFYKEFATFEDPKTHKVLKGKFADMVEVAVPYCLGDSYAEFRVVATMPDLFEKLSYGSYDEQYRCVPPGRFFGRDETWGAVVGSVAARKTDLVLGKKFRVTHNVPEPGLKPHVHHEEFTVVGILEPTGTPNDRAVFVNMKGFYAISGHEGLVKGIKEYPNPFGGADEHVESDHEHADEHQADSDRDHANKHDEHPDKSGAPDKKDPVKKPDAKPAAHADKHDQHDAKHEEHSEKSDPHDKKSTSKPDGHAADEHAIHKAGHADDHDADHKPGEKHEADHKPHDDHDAAHKPGEEDDADHDHEEHHHVPDSQREVTAVLLKLKGGEGQSAALAQELAKEINKGDIAQAVSPVGEVQVLMDGIVGTVRWILLVLAVLVVIEAGIGVLVSIYNSMSDRSREIAIMRSLGASRGTVMLVVLLESILLSLLGGIAGVVLAHGTIMAIAPLIVHETGASIGMFQFEPIELVLIPGLVVLASIVGYLPALAAYRTDVAKAASRGAIIGRMMLAKRTILILMLCLAVLGLTSPSTVACPFCGPVGQTLNGEIDTASVAVIAQWRRPGSESAKASPEELKAEFAIVRIIKGRELLGKARTLRTMYFADVKPGTNFLMLGNDPPQLRWVTRIAMTEREWEYLRTLLELPRKGAERLAFVFKYLEAPEEMLRRDAYDEFASAPYNIIRDLGPRLKPDLLLDRLKNPKTDVPRLRLYFTLLGTCGRPADASVLEEMLRSDQPQYRQSLDALVASYLRLKGPDGLQLVEQLFLTSESPDDGAKANAAIMALRFLGQEDDVVHRADIVRLMESLLKRPQLGGKVLADLSRWNDWTIIDRAAEMFVKAQGETLWIREPVVGYLNACPLPAAKTQLEKLAKIDPETVKRGTDWYSQDTTSSVHMGSQTPTAAATTAPKSANAGDSVGAAAAPTDVRNSGWLSGWTLPAVAGGLLIVVLLGVAVARRRV